MTQSAQKAAIRVIPQCQYCAGHHDGICHHAPHEAFLAARTPFDKWYSNEGHWIYQNRAEALEAFNRGLA